MEDEGRNVIVGLDGVPHSLMEDLSQSGVMPNFAGLRDEGSLRKMDSSIPAVSSTSWGTIFTGKNPGEHGVFGFTDIIKGTYTLSFSNFLSFKSPAFWQEGGGVHVILNVPSTYPAQELRGYLISGFVSPNMEKAVYPGSILEKLEDLKYKIDVDSEKAYKSERLLFKELYDALEARIKAYRYFWNKSNWGTFMVVFTGSDRLEHFLWDAYEDPEHDHHDRFLDFFERMDGVIGEIDDRLNEEDSLILLSDHGMEGVKYNVNINAYLEKKGYLKLSDDEKKKRYNRIKGGTKAFALEHGRIYLNREGEYPRGTVREEEEKEITHELKNSLRSLKIKGRAVIDEIWERDEIYTGEQVKNAPELVLVPKAGYNLRGKLSEDIYEESPLTGMHNREAFLYGEDNGIQITGNPSVEDVVPMMRGA